MASTVMAERKLAVETETSENMSRTGFMNTPPPTPQMLPITEAKKAMAKRNTTSILTHPSIKMPGKACFPGSLFYPRGGWGRALRHSAVLSPVIPPKV